MKEFGRTVPELLMSSFGVVPRQFNRMLRTFAPLKNSLPVQLQLSDRWLLLISGTLIWCRIQSWIQLFEAAKVHRWGEASCLCSAAGISAVTVTRIQTSKQPGLCWSGCWWAPAVFWPRLDRKWRLLACLFCRSSFWKPVLIVDPEPTFSGGILETVCIRCSSWAEVASSGETGLKSVSSGHDLPE